jgi:hypothetical protein
MEYRQHFRSLLRQFLSNFFSVFDNYDGTNSGRHHLQLLPDLLGQQKGEAERCDELVFVMIRVVADAYQNDARVNTPT